MKFEHNGIEIQLDQSTGQFRAFVNGVNGKVISKSSLKAMKDHLDRLAKSKFKPIKVLVSSWSGVMANVKGTDLVRAEAVSIEKSQARFSRGRQHQFQVKVASGALQQVAACYQDCQEAIDAWKAIEAHSAETRKIEERRMRELESLEKRLKKFELDPDEFVTKKAGA